MKIKFFLLFLALALLLGVKAQAFVCGEDFYDQSLVYETIDFGNGLCLFKNKTNSKAKVLGETTSNCYRDNDGDGWGSFLDNSKGKDLKTGLCRSGYVNKSGDCQDKIKNAYPGAEEICDQTAPANRIDNNCNGVKDEGCVACYPDYDGDGYAGKNKVVYAKDCNFKKGWQYYTKTDDCNDQVKNINPGAKEVCDKYKADEDCDNQNNEGCATKDCYGDKDGDGFGGAKYSRQEFFEDKCPSNYANNNLDCDDNRKNINPNGQEECDDAGLDENCNKQINEGCTRLICYTDLDKDGYGGKGAKGSVFFGDNCPEGRVTNNSDCSDADKFINPGVKENCDVLRMDENCNGQANEGCPSKKCVQDKDGDGEGDFFAKFLTYYVDACPKNMVDNNKDCKDNDPSINTKATEICDKGEVDENCNGLKNEFCPKWRCYEDNDKDGFGNRDRSPDRWFYEPCPKGTVKDATDCQDKNEYINPTATEICEDGLIDENCNGKVNENCSTITCYRDVDGDSFGNNFNWKIYYKSACPAGWLLDNKDCQDGDPKINPQAIEICDYNNTDENCNKQVNEGCQVITCYNDGDGDAYGDNNKWQAYYGTSCPSGKVTKRGDCNDRRSEINSAQKELCDKDMLDENCNGKKNEGCVACFIDADKDGAGDKYKAPVYMMSQCSAGYVYRQNDCNDANAAINPSAKENCFNKIDDNCDGRKDDGKGKCY